jgi:hypothetical protein
LKRVSATCILILLYWSSHGQNLYYEYSRGGNPIGSLEVIYGKEDSTETYRLKSVVDFKIIFTFSVEYVLTETFAQGKLIRGEGFNTMNGVSQKETKIRLKDDGYHLKIDGIEGYNERRPIEHSMSRIYHEELYDGKRLYSQYFGRYLVAEKLGEHKYSIKSPDGENIYTYEYGYCTEVKVIRDFATFHIRMLPETLASLKPTKE